MQSKAFLLSPHSSSSSVIRNTEPLYRNPNPSFRLNYIRLYSSSFPNSLNNGNVIHGVSVNSFSTYSSPLRTNPSSVGDSNLGSCFSKTIRDFKVRATDEIHESSSSNSLSQKLELGILFGLWYVSNIYFNIYNKQVCFCSF